jgi:phage portal protein BeeE
MALWPTRARASVADAQTRLQVREIIPGMRVFVPSWQEFASYSELYALQVPALTRGVRLISGTVAQLPLETWQGQANIDVDTPQPGVARWVTMQRTAQDLVLHGYAYWRRTVGGVVWMPAAETTRTPTNTVTDSHGHEYTIADPTKDPVNGQVIAFTGYREPLLTIGSDAIITAMAIEAASRVYAETPSPNAVLKNTSNYELDDAEIDTLLANYKDARKDSNVAYLNGGIDLVATGFDAVQTALVEQRNQSSLAMARLLNLDPSWVGASVAGSSLTYSNRIDLRTDLYGLTLTDYLLPIEQRLGMPDMGGAKVQFSASEFLRANLPDRVTMAVALVAAGILTTVEARAFISDEPTGGAV